LAYGAYQGVFIGGGIVQRYPDALLESRFRYGFENKGRHEEFMKNIPSWLITHQNPGLVGAASYARQQSKKST
ncbi:MAG: glucokinase, partial [Pseudomonadota bacterium]